MNGSIPENAEPFRVQTRSIFEKMHQTHTEEIKSREMSTKRSVPESVQLSPKGSLPESVELYRRFQT